MESLGNCVIGMKLLVGDCDDDSAEIKGEHLRNPNLFFYFLLSSRRFL